ncbi:MAG: nicotinate-nucleotide adenylyltransferase [Candidatus Omnitrophica bacterium]|nr:nicotinate-nucleotide adenylyltransferase [Candidatus Omnitrophota bacterium]MDD5575005.1 nicotinate-nucleotide adenylyltransferase [Candidatus Omnitrophota bacterium]
MMKIGILGGTFNPVHFGHLILAEQVRGQLGLDRVIFVPAFMPPHKDGRDIIPAKNRFEMLGLAVGDNKDFAVSDIEIRRRGKSYTVDTLRQIKKRYPHAELFFICGSDLVAEIPTWKDVDEIYRLAKFVLARRPCYGKRLSGKPFIKINVAQVDISSSLIRKLIRQKRSVRYLTPNRVVKYIEQHKLYR